MKLELVSVGKLKHKAYLSLFEDYAKRLKRAARFEHSTVRESRSRDVSSIMREEAQAFEQRCQPHTLRVALDERGALLTSHELANTYQGWMNASRRHVALFVGGAHGLDPEFRTSCNLVLGLSRMTLPHDMALVMLVEQLYRATSILNNDPYHK